MNTNVKRFIVSFLLFTSIVLLTNAQENNMRTLSYNKNTVSPKADLSAINWLAGHWKGEAFGGTTEEIWVPAMGNSMMGMFKLIENNEVQFYELCSITETEGTLILRIVHFNPNMTLWEEKPMECKLVKVEENRIYFDDFTIEKINDNEINMYVVINNKEVQFNYTK